MIQTFDVVVIGAGIAGASIAAEIAAHRTVLIAEAEEHPGYHTTGRSAAFWEECYGGPDVLPLTRGSGPWFRERGFLSDRGALYLARAQDASLIDDFFGRFEQSGADAALIDRPRLESMVPGLAPEWDRAIHQPRCADIDVAAVHQHYLASARERGTTIACGRRFRSAERSKGLWRLQFDKGDAVQAGIIVNSAGAWADDVAQRCGASPLGIRPYRRTVAQLRTDPPPPSDLPLCLDISGDFYFKPESGKVWLSPHDEIPSEACDAVPDEIDVARAIDRFGKVVNWQVLALEHKWAGLRSFAPDRLPVYGFDRRVDGLFWFAGQGGFGIQTAPAAARLGAQLLLDAPCDAMTEALDTALYSPARFTPAAV
ncbi:FAD-binding oxidoreductase [Aurantiacibacter aquimixticola]|uniref:NAD(P)/FAD-dependent oxidoreductase n=1 Tax=Aurantiacibacter aquimixticola TaxID=1958945 RepID=UPI00267B96E9